MLFWHLAFSPWSDLWPKRETPQRAVLTECTQPPNLNAHGGSSVRMVDSCVDAPGAVTGAQRFEVSSYGCPAVTGACRVRAPQRSTTVQAAAAASAAAAAAGPLNAGCGAIATVTEGRGL